MDTWVLLTSFLTVLLTVYIIKWRCNPLNSIPTAGGPSLPLLSYWSAWRFMRDAREVLTEGYTKYQGVAFKIALPNQWMVMLNGPTLLDDLRRRPEEELSLEEVIEQFSQISYTLGRELYVDQFHIDLVREKLTRSLPAILPDVIDELNIAVPTYLPTRDDAWTTVKLVNAIQSIVACTTNRVFVGAPLCRNPDYLKLAVRASVDVVKDRNILMLVPSFLKPFVASIYSRLRATTNEMLVHFEPIFKERRARMEGRGHWEDGAELPNDMMQWLIEAEAKRNNSDKSIAARILLLNAAAIDTSSMSAAHALLDLAAFPEFVEPLRAEIEGIIATEGWTKTSLGKMWKLDSLLKESQRFHGMNSLTLGRRAMKDITLIDGTLIPAGIAVSAPAYAVHHDPAIYPSPDVFDPFRFARLRGAEGEGTKHQFVKTSLDYISFGHGKQACPGRFFAANEMKALLAYILINYDIKLAGDSRPENVCYGPSVLPNPNAEVLFRRRRVK